MNKIKNDSGITEFGFTKPAIYQIEVLGEISEQSYGYFNNMKISTSVEPGNKPISILTGKIKDQSELIGVLNTLNNMHHSILSIKTIENGL